MTRLKRCPVVFVLAGFLTGSAPLSAGNFTSGTQTAVKFGVHEIVLTGDGSVPNPFDTIVRVRFTPPSGAANARTVWAFYDGGNTWRARVYPTEAGAWHWSSMCATDARLADKSGRFRCEASKLRGRLLVHPKNSRQWMTEDGRWFLNLNDTSYYLLCAYDGTGTAIPDDDVRAYVKDAMDRGITSFRSFIAKGKKESRGRDRTDRKRWYDLFSDKEQTRPDLDHLRVADRRLRLLLDEFPDAYLQFILFPLGKAYRTDEVIWTKMTRAQRERIMRTLIARFGAYPQIFWLIVNDAHFSPVTIRPRPNDPDQRARTQTFPNNCAMMREVGAFFQKHDPWRHPLSAGPARGVPFHFDTESWATYVHLEEDFDVSAKRYEKYHALGKPVFLGEDRYEHDHPATHDPRDMRYVQRRLFWSWLLAGGSGNYGGRWWVLQPYSQTGKRPTVSILHKDHTYTTALTGLDSVKYIRDYFVKRHIELSNFAPDHSRVRDPKISTAINAPRLMRREKDEFLVYHPNAIGVRRDMRAEAQRTAHVRLDLRDAPGSFHIEWYRPLDGTTREGGITQGGMIVELTSPWPGHDVVVRLNRARKP